MADRQYTLYSSDTERARLMRQAEQLRGSTEQLFRAAGIGPGQRVLDIGSGAGDVAMIVADLVGPTGEVIGIDRDKAQVEAAGRRCADAGLGQVRFINADLHEAPDGPFNAVVGRLVLMYSHDPVA